MHGGEYETRHITILSYFVSCEKGQVYPRGIMHSTYTIIIACSSTPSNNTYSTIAIPRLLSHEFPGWCQCSTRSSDKKQTRQTTPPPPRKYNFPQSQVPRKKEAHKQFPAPFFCFTQDRSFMIAVPPPHWTPTQREGTIVEFEGVAYTYHPVPVVSSCPAGLKEKRAPPSFPLPGNVVFMHQGGYCVKTAPGAQVRS